MHDVRCGLDGLLSALPRWWVKQRVLSTRWQPCALLTWKVEWLHGWLSTCDCESYLLLVLRWMWHSAPPHTRTREKKEMRTTTGTAKKGAYITLFLVAPTTENDNADSLFYFPRGLVYRESFLLPLFCFKYEKKTLKRLKLTHRNQTPFFFF